MEVTDIASHVEQYDPIDHDNCLRGMGLSKQITPGASWMVTFTSADGALVRSHRTGFLTKDEAEAFKNGWNSHRRKVSEILFNDSIKKKTKKLRIQPLD